MKFVVCKLCRNERSTVYWVHSNNHEGYYNQLEITPHEAEVIGLNPPPCPSILGVEVLALAHFELLLFY